MKVSIVIPVYFNQDNLLPLYRDMQEKLFVHTEIEWEIVMVNDGSQDNSYQVMQELAKQDSRIRIFSVPELGFACGDTLRPVEMHRRVCSGEGCGSAGADTACPGDG